MGQVRPGRGLDTHKSATLPMLVNPLHGSNQEALPYYSSLPPRDAGNTYDAVVRQQSKRQYEAPVALNS